MKTNILKKMAIVMALCLAAGLVGCGSSSGKRIISSEQDENDSLNSAPKSDLTKQEMLEAIKAYESKSSGSIPLVYDDAVIDSMELTQDDGTEKVYTVSIEKKYNYAIESIKKEISCTWDSEKSGYYDIKSIEEIEDVLNWDLTGTWRFSGDVSSNTNLTIEIVVDSIDVKKVSDVVSYDAYLLNLSCRYNGKHLNFDINRETDGLVTAIFKKEIGKSINPDENLHVFSQPLYELPQYEAPKTTDGMPISIALNVNNGILFYSGEVPEDQAVQLTRQ